MKVMFSNMNIPRELAQHAHVDIHNCVYAQYRTSNSLLISLNGMAQIMQTKLHQRV